MKTFPAKSIYKRPEGVLLSPAMERLYTKWPAADDRLNEFFTNFKYSRITGIGEEKGVSRRDPSKVIQVKGVYYVYYTRRKTQFEPIGIDIDNYHDDIPTYDWDLCDIYYATSKDGFDWEEQGIAVGRNEKGSYGDRSVSTPDILVWQEKYYLYYQTYTGYFSASTQDYCGISMAWSDSPSGPWTKVNEELIPQGEKQDWDSMAIHDPYPLIYKDQIWLYYKGENLKIDGEEDSMVRAQGVAIADAPEGPFVKHPMNPLTNAGHETFLYPYKEGIAAVLTSDGVEKNSIQYAQDGLNFELKSFIHCPPTAAGVYSPDAFTDNGNAEGVSWGLSHIKCGFGFANCFSYLVRFDCSLEQNRREKFLVTAEGFHGRYGEDTYFAVNMMLPQEVREEIIARELMQKKENDR